MNRTLLIIISVALVTLSTAAACLATRDIAIVATGQSVSPGFGILEGDGQGYYTYDYHAGYDGNCFPIAVADFNGDLILDVAIGLEKESILFERPHSAAIRPGEA